MRNVGIVYLGNYKIDVWGPLRYVDQRDSGFDLRAAFEPTDAGVVIAMLGDKPRIEVMRGKVIRVRTGIVIDLPPGVEGQIRSRSELVHQKGAVVAQGVGTVDSGYRGEVTVLLTNVKDAPCFIRQGDRIAQLVLARTERAQLVPVDLRSLSTTTHSGETFNPTKSDIGQ